jgi:peptide/nickel transport system ATP-binding protein
MYTDTPILQVNDLQVAYRQRRHSQKRSGLDYLKSYLYENSIDVLKCVSFNLYSGKILAVLGESGSGKSTIARTISGLLPASAHIKSGTVRYGDFSADLTVATPLVWRKVRGSMFTMIFQDAGLALNPLMTIGDHFKEVILFHRLAAVEDVGRISAELLQKLNFKDTSRILNAYPFQLSGGMCQRIYIALSLCLKPKVLIADEPTSAIDTVSQKEVLDLIKHIQHEFNLAVLLITHDMAVARTVSDQVMVLNKGIIEEIGDTEKIFANPAAPYTKELIDSRSRIESIECIEDESSRKTVLLDIENIGKRFLPNKNHVLCDLNLKIHEKEVIGVLGQSGCGKSTLARCIVGLARPDQGKLIFRGRDITALPENKRREMCQHIQIVFQDARASLNPRHTALRLVREPLRYFNRGQPEEQEEKARYYLNQVGIDDNACTRRPPQLSTGQCQRIAIARALVLEPDILICDEAVSALDMSIQVQILALLRDLHEKLRFSILMISHDIRILRHFCHLIAVMKDGNFCEINNAKYLLEESRDTYTKSLLACELAYE